jgi:hypothetical protein
LVSYCLQGGIVTTSIIKNKTNPIVRSILIIAGFVIPALLIGCSGRYGRLVLDQQVQEAFESNHPPADYKYYYYGFDTEPYAVFGIEPKYSVKSKMWREATPDTAEFQNMIRWVWEDYGYTKFGADILDPDGQKVGILYTAILQTSVKFVDDNQIVVMPGSPFLWGPDGTNDWAP